MSLSPHSPVRGVQASDPRPGIPSTTRPDSVEGEGRRQQSPSLRAWGEVARGGTAGGTWHSARLRRGCCEQMLGVRLLSDALGRPGGPPAPRRLSYRLAGLRLVHPSDPAPQAQATGPSCRDLRVLASVFL